MRTSGGMLRAAPGGRFGSDGKRFALLLAPFILAAAGAPAAPVPGKAAPEAMASEIDRRLRAVWKEGYLEPAPPLADGLFLRRLSIDLRGVIPHVEEVLQYESDPDPGKAAKWTGWFLETPSFAEHFAELWEQILIGRKGNADGLDRDGFREWLRKGFLAGKPYDRLARELITAEGLPQDDPAVSFFLRYEARPEEMAGRISRVFLGTRIECAQCHDHPYMDVKREEFYGLAAFLARARRFRQEDRAGGDSMRRGLRESLEGEVMMPPMKRGEEPVPVAPLVFGERGADAKKRRPAARTSLRPEAAAAKRDAGGMAGGMGAAEQAARAARRGPAEPTRREQLAKWLTDPKNPYFSRALVNRLWAHFLGKGFVNPVDDFSVDSKIVFPELLDLLGKDFVASGHDLRRLIRIITATEAYRQQALSAAPGGLATGEGHDFFASVPLRPLEAEVLARSVLRATGMEEPQPEKNAERVRQFIDEAHRTIQKRFGIDESERRAEFQGTVLQVLLLFNGELTSGKAPASRPFHPPYEKKLAGNLDVVLQGIAPGGHVERLFLAVLSRLPAPEEQAAFGRYLASAESEAQRTRALADIQWALLNSAEFLHQH
jgi:hypothetical protein